MKTIDIKGKPYVMVNTRVKEFRENYKGWSLISEIISITDNSCIIKASVIDENGVVRATGYAQEDKASSLINKTSYVENCETCAWGRALGNLGIGIDEAIASAEEVNIAIAKQVNYTSFNEVVGGDFVLTFGKYSGKTLKYINEETADYEYLRWLADNGSEDVKANLNKYKETLKEKKR